MKETTIDRAYMDLRIREVMQRKGVTGLELAARLGKHSQYIYNIINGGPQASVGALISVAKALDVPFRDLFGPGTTRSMDLDNTRKKLSTTDTLLAKCPHCGNTIEITIK